jgi:DNA-directed RNA polymerase specialized sigma24 family protein
MSSRRDHGAQRSEDAKRALRQVGDRIRRAKANLDESQDAREDAIRKADKAGMTRRAIADAVGVSYGRVEQILKKGATRGSEARKKT